MQGAASLMEYVIASAALFTAEANVLIPTNQYIRY